jgi:hypothetical protein
MELWSLESALRRDLGSVIRMNIATGVLPQSPPILVSTKAGSGATCAACGRAIDHLEPENKVTAGGATLALHEKCFQTWRDELQRHD